MVRMGRGETTTPAVLPWHMDAAAFNLFFIDGSGLTEGRRRPGMVRMGKKGQTHTHTPAVLPNLLVLDLPCRSEGGAEAAGDGEDGEGRNHHPCCAALAHGCCGRALCRAGQQHPQSCRLARCSYDGICLYCKCCLHMVCIVCGMLPWGLGFGVNPKAYMPWQSAMRSETATPSKLQVSVLLGFKGSGYEC